MKKLVALLLTLIFVAAVPLSASASDHILGIRSIGDSQSLADEAALKSEVIIGDLSNSVSLGAMSMESKQKLSSNCIMETYSAIIEISEAGVAKIVSSVPATTRSSSTSQTEQNIYWKASITATYEYSNEFGRLISVSGYWTQLHGVTTLSGRHVHYGQSGASSTTADKYPTSNSFSYSTGFSTVKLSSFGCSSEATVTTQAGGTLSLYVNIFREGYQL